MLRYPRYIAPALLASFVGLTATAARAEPATAASPAADADCLAKPNGAAAPGNHWYYHVDRASGRRCWYQRAGSGGSSGARNDAAPSRSLPARAMASPPADTVASEGAADTASDSRDQSTASPLTAAPAQPYGWSTAAPAAAPREPTTAPAGDSSAPAPDSLTPPSAAAEVPARVAPPAAPTSRAPARTTAAAEQVAAPVEAEAVSHMPALLGAALALLIVVLGSIVARLAAGLIRARRRPAYDDIVDTTTPPMVDASDAPALVPVMPRDRDMARNLRAPRLPRETPAAPSRRAPDDADIAGDPAEQVRADARVLEENVRDLLRRMRSDLFDQQPAPEPPAAPAAPAPQPTAAQELNRMLARLREQRRKPA